MALQHEPEIEQRRFLAINFWIGTRGNGYLIGPALVSTNDYELFHFWDEPLAAALDMDDYEIMKLYPRGLTLEEAARLFSKDFTLAAADARRSTGWATPLGALRIAGPWSDLDAIPVIAA
ncbi:MAG: hypothetical protein ACJ8CR_08180 [Roseiflexaceae bacterium]